MELVVVGMQGLVVIVLAVIIESQRKALSKQIEDLDSLVQETIKNLTYDILENQVQTANKVNKEDWEYANKLLMNSSGQLSEGLTGAVISVQKKLDTVTRQLNSVSEALLEKEDKRTLTIDEALARIPKKSALKEKKPSRKTPTLARKLTKAK
jgi:hypothetical protein